ncbi:MAG: DUF1622 domain-containing protein [Kiritimatiellia bacterium]
MIPEQVNAGIELIARALEVVGVAVIALAFAYVLLRGLLHLGQKRADAYRRVKVYIGQALLLGLEFLVAADIIRTVTVAPTVDGLLSLGLLIVVRIALGWSIAVEIEGCWPWQAAKMKRGEGQTRGEGRGTREGA